MLSRLLVKNYVLIDSLEIGFPEGLVIITGQTGAGKSIMLGALGLIMGAKADAAMVSEGADNCVVEAEFVVGSDNQELRSLLEDNEVEWNDESVIIRRVVSRSGRSRAFVNDSPVSVQVLQDMSSHLIDIHSQHQTLLLSDRRFQLGILDYFAASSESCDRCADLWKRINVLKSQLADLDARIAGIESEREYNQAQFRQLESASLRVGELAELEEEQRTLANAEEIKSGLCTVENIFSNNGQTDDSQSLDSSLKEAERMLSRLSRFVPSASSLAERVASCRVELDDVLSEVSDINSAIEMSASRLEEVEGRMSLIYGLLQKHGCADEAGLIALRDSLSETLADSDLLQDKRNGLILQLSDLETQLRTEAEHLHDARQKAIAPFAKDMTDSIRSMELPHAVFEVELIPVQLGPSGYDSVQFRFSSSGGNAVDVARCASGGEMSRIMLAMKAMKARYAKMPTMVFDEIDTGVSGSVADRMGAVICEMGRYMQVFAITHLPQVAAKGSAHYLVSKDVDPTTFKAVSHIERLSDEQRVLEVARMLSGSVMTDAAVANARELLNS